MSSQAVAWAIVMQAGSPSAKAVLMAIANYANEYGECWAGQDTLAEGAELKERQLRTILGHLIERGLVERVRRGGQGRGRQTDMLRLRMRELPAIITAKRRPEEPSNGNRQSLPLTEQPAVSGSNRQYLPPATGGGATGNLEGGNRQMVAATKEPKNPRTQTPKPPGFEEAWSLWPKHVRASSKQESAKRLSKFGVSGVDIVAAVSAYLRSPDATKDGRKFVPAFEVWLNKQAEFWLEQIQPDPAEIDRRRRLYAFDGTWRPEWGDPPPRKQGSHP